MASYRREQRPDNSSTWLILGIVGGALLLLLLICGGILYMWLNLVRSGTEMIRETETQFFQQVHKMQQQAQEQQEQLRRQQQEAAQSQAVARAFLGDGLAGRINAAYGVTTAGFKKGTTAEQLTALFTKHPLANQKDPFANPAVLVTVGDHHYRYSAPMPDGAWLDFTVTVVREGDGWKVDHLSVDGPNRKGPQ
jgi:hypothetical protein